VSGTQIGDRKPISRQRTEADPENRTGIKKEKPIQKTELDAANRAEPEPGELSWIRRTETNPGN
jgi:hypothetical protein